MNFCCDSWKKLTDDIPKIIVYEDGKIMEWIEECVSWECGIPKEIHRPEFDFIYCPYCGKKLPTNIKL